MDILRFNMGISGIGDRGIRFLGILFVGGRLGFSRRKEVEMILLLTVLSSYFAIPKTGTIKNRCNLMEFGEIGKD